MDLQLQAGFTVSESGFGFVIRMHFYTESETRFGVNPNPDSIIEYALRQQKHLPDGKREPCSSNSCITSRRRLSRTRRRDTLVLPPGELGVRGDRGVRGEPNTPSSNSPAAAHSAMTAV